MRARGASRCSCCRSQRWTLRLPADRGRHRCGRTLTHRLSVRRPGRGARLAAPRPATSNGNRRRSPSTRTAYSSPASRVCSTCNNACSFSRVVGVAARQPRRGGDCPGAIAALARRRAARGRSWTEAEEMLYAAVAQSSTRSRIARSTRALSGDEGRTAARARPGGRGGRSSDWSTETRARGRCADPHAARLARSRARRTRGTRRSTCALPRATDAILRFPVGACRRATRLGRRRPAHDRVGQRGAARGRSSASRRSTRSCPEVDVAQWHDGAATPIRALAAVRAGHAGYHVLRTADDVQVLLAPGRVEVAARRAARAHAALVAAGPAARRLWSCGSARGSA